MFVAGVVQKDSSDRLVVVDNGTGFFNGGTPVDATGQLLVAGTGGLFHNAGLLYDAAGYLVVIDGGTIANITPDGFGVDSTGALCVAYNGTPATYIAGVPFDTNGRVCVAGASPPPPTGNGILQEDGFNILTESLENLVQES
jgi:hypothetical protein